MHAFKYLTSYTGTSRFIFHQFKSCFKVNYFRESSYFISRNTISQDQYCSLTNRLEHFCLLNNQYLIPRRGFNLSSYFFEEKKLDDDNVEQPEKLSLVKRYKKMLKEYWYVLIPVHIATSVVWFGSFYYVAKSGFDIIPFLEMINLPEKIIQPLRSSSLGYIAVASALYKLATPARYMVTLGGTTVAIKQLTKRGLIKPVPSRAKFKTMIQNKLQPSKDNLKSKDS